MRRETRRETAVRECAERFLEELISGGTVSQFPIINFYSNRKVFDVAKAKLIEAIGLVIKHEGENNGENG